MHARLARLSALVWLGSGLVPGCSNPAGGGEEEGSSSEGGDTGSSSGNGESAGDSSSGGADDSESGSAESDGTDTSGGPLECTSDDECRSGVCDEASGTCVAPSCTDGLLNGDETDLDCGGSCGGCNVGAACGAAEDCASSFCSASECAIARDCSALKAAGPNLPDGRYTVDLDGVASAYAPMEVECDMTTDGGGWMLVLNYLHQAETNPELVVLSDRLPLVESTTLGLDGSLDATTWGHAGNALMADIEFQQTMWFAKTSFHDRVIHFVSDSPEVVSYIKTGSGSMSPTIFSGQHSRSLDQRVRATLPLHAAPFDISAYDSQGDFAMTQFPFYGDSAIDNPRAHWAVRGEGQRWEVDDYPEIQDSCSYCNDTLHQVWVRRDLCSNGVADGDESDVDCGGQCGGCEAEQTCAEGNDCLSGTCDGGSCSATLATSCAALLDADPGLRSGAFALDVDGTDELNPVLAWCDMSFDDGGWTMVLSTADFGGSTGTTVGDVLPGTASHLDSVVMSVLAAGSEQVHIRTLDGADDRSVTSVIGSPAIDRLAAGQLLAQSPNDYVEAEWTGPLAVPEVLGFSCDNEYEYPSIYQTCGGTGLHLWAGDSRWHWLDGNDGLNEPMEVYVR